MERLLELLNAQPAISSPENPTALPDTRHGHIRFDKVSFRYPSRPDALAISTPLMMIRPSWGE
jgi:ATP-binding cassette subfamily B protein